MLLDRLHQLKLEKDDDAFYNSALCRNLDLMKQFMLFQTSNRTFNFLQYPFLLDAVAKSKLVSLGFKELREQAARAHPASPITLLAIRREFVFNDAVSQIHLLSASDLLRPLRVIFSGEEGLDEGGPRRELFMLLLLKIMDLNAGLWTFYETGVYWFAPEADVSGGTQLFELIGTIMGLAIANQSIINVSFPLYLYSRLLSKEEKQPSLDQLAEIDPSLAKGLNDLLKMENDAIAELGLNFAVERNVFGQVQLMDLIENGQNVSVTAFNVKKYVDLYCHYFLVRSCEVFFNAFRQGFQKAIAMETNVVIPLLSASELKALVQGRGNVHIRLLDLKSKLHLVGFHLGDRIIQDFFSIVASWSQERVKQFLIFLTGSSGVPIEGLGGIRLIIQKSGDDSNRLPVAHTCGTVLDLPLYKTREELQEKLEFAILEGNGSFNLI